MTPPLSPSMAAWSAAWQRQDVEALRACYAAGGVVMHPRQPLVRGAAQIGSFFERGMGRAEVRFEPLSLNMGTELAFESGLVRDYDRHSGALLLTSDYLVTWVRDGSEWRILAHAWNSRPQAQ